MTYLKTMTKHASKFLLAAVLAVAALLLLAIVPVLSDADAQRAPTSQAEIDLTFAPLVKSASPAVVNIYTTKKMQSRASAMRRAYGRVPQSRQNSLGSGVIVRADGVVVTNNHVIEGADGIRVVLNDRREYAAELILADERTDLAVLKVDTEGAVLPTLGYADTRGVEIGDLVLAIGNPFGVGQTVTSGIISATARTDVGVSDYAFFLQTDAAVNPGNSGGALVNTKGELVGVNTAIFSRSGGSNGIGFAIPAEMVQRVVNAGMNDGTFVRPWLGLAGQSVSFDIAKAQGLERPIGVLVTEVFEDGPADKAGLRRGDLVTAIDGRDVFDEKGLKFLAAVRNPGETARLSVLRGGQARTMGVTVQPPPGATEADLVVLTGRHAFSGARIVALSPRLAEENGLDPFTKGSGIYIHSVLRRSIARNFFRPGDVILSIDGRKVKTVSDLQSILAQPRGSWDVELNRNGRVVKGTARL
jgi:Do/DeqQ family serine protease